MDRFFPVRRRRAVQRATARLRGAALAIAVFAAGVREQALAATGPDAQGLADARTRYASLLERRSTLSGAHQLLQELEERRVAYAGRPPRYAPASGWQLPTVQVARARLDEAHDSLLGAIETAHASLGEPGDPAPGDRG